MNILIINSVCGIRSTGRICTDIATEYIREGHTVRIAYGRENIPDEFSKISIKIGTECNSYIHFAECLLFDNEGFGSTIATRKFLKWANIFNPDMVWLHNLHGHYINIGLLFDWIKSRPQMKVKWTLHDCWAFTGHCTHFAMIKCDKWQYKCEKCPQRKKYPKSLLVDNSCKNYLRKKQLFSGISDMTIIVPSFWMKNQVEKSFLNQYKIEVIYNEIDKKTFKPTTSDFRYRYGIENKKIVLGVASSWGIRKGLGDMILLSEMLDSSYQVVLVGLTKKEIKKLPSSIIAIERTNSKKELAEIYSAADVYVNPSRQESFGLTTIEALACGVFPIVYVDTACEEIVEQYGGMAVPQNIEALYQAIVSVCETPRERM